MNKVIKINAKSWKQDLDKYNITYIDSVDKLKEVLDNNNPIFTSRCSKTKKVCDMDIPKNFYVSSTNNLFYEHMEKNNLYYGILSDKYGIHFCDEKLEYYDIHPSSLSIEDKSNLGLKIKNKIKNKYDSIIFYNPSPVMSTPYFEMMYLMNIKIFFITKIKIVDEYFERGKN